MTSFGGIAHLDLTVTDAEASADWYQRVLGLDRVKRAEPGNRIMIVLRHRQTGLVIGLNQHLDATADRFDEQVPGLDHVGLAVATRAELDAWAERLDALGVAHSPVTDSPSGSGTALVFRDPDNIQLEMWWTRA